MPVETFRGDGRIMGAHHGVIAERRDDARPMGGGQPRQRRDIEMIIMPVRHQHRIDRRQCIECDARIVDPFRSGKADRGGTRRPHGIAQEVDTARLDEKARMADKADPDRRPRDAGGRTVRMGARRPFRPFFAASGGEPPQHVEGAFRRRAQGIAEPDAIEVIRHRPIMVGLRPRAQPSGPAAECRGAGEPGKHVATRWRHLVHGFGLAAARLSA